MRLANLCWPDAAAVLARDPVVLLPMGTLEVHGRHLPLNTDMLAPDCVADRIEALCPEVLILPPLPIGECDSQTEFPGTISLGPKLLYEVLHKIFFSLYRHGAPLRCPERPRPQHRRAGPRGDRLVPRGGAAGGAELVALRVGLKPRVEGRARRRAGNGRHPRD